MGVEALIIVGRSATGGPCLLPEDLSTRLTVSSRSAHYVGLSELLFVQASV